MSPARRIHLEAMRTHVSEASVLRPDVSKWSVGMHVHHCCLAMIGVCDSLLASEPPPPHTGFSLVTSAIFLTGRIPRGRGKSPAQVLPREGIEPEELADLLDQSEQRIELVAAAPPDQWFRHFAFGVMDRDRTLRFLQIHNQHHLRIVQDILGA